MLNIMLIEDDDEDAFMIRRAIEKHVRDADCVRVQTLAAGERMLKENGTDVIILDLHLPDSVNPADDCARIFKCAGKAPVVISTNTTDRVLANILVHAGAEDFLDKQSIASDPARIRDAIHFAIERHDAVRRLMTEKERAESDMAEKDTMLNCFMGGYSVTSGGS